MWEHWIQSYGYWAVFLGGILEGETVLILAGYSLSRGYLDPLPTYLLAVLGAAAGDTLYYWLGRWYGPGLLRRFVGIRTVRARAALLLRRWGRVTAFLTRFAYGLRTVLPALIGAARMPPLLFSAFNVLGAFCFAALYLGLGYLFGEAAEELFGRVRPYEPRILLGILVAGLLIWAVREWRLFHSRIEDDPDDEQQR